MIKKLAQIRDKSYFLYIISLIVVAPVVVPLIILVGLSIFRDSSLLDASFITRIINIDKIMFSPHFMSLKTIQATNSAEPSFYLNTIDQVNNIAIVVMNSMKLGILVLLLVSICMDLYRYSKSLKALK